MPPPQLLHGILPLGGLFHSFLATGRTGATASAVDFWRRLACDALA
jgi:hypothetical protein